MGHPPKPNKECSSELMLKTKYVKTH